MDMLRNISGMFAGNDAELPPRYYDIVSKKDEKPHKKATVSGVMKNLQKHLL